LLILKFNDYLYKKKGRHLPQKTTYNKIKTNWNLNHRWIGKGKNKLHLKYLLEF